MLLSRHTRRRTFITLLGGAAAAWPLAGAQQAASLPAVGFLGAGSPTTADVWLSAFMSRLRELGWIEGRNIKIDVRWAEGRNDRSAEIIFDAISQWHPASNQQNASEVTPASTEDDIGAFGKSNHRSQWDASEPGPEADATEGTPTH